MSDITFRQEFMTLAQNESAIPAIIHQLPAPVSPDLTTSLEGWRPFHNSMSSFMMSPSDRHTLQSTQIANPVIEEPMYPSGTFEPSQSPSQIEQCLCPGCTTSGTARHASVHGHFATSNPVHLASAMTQASQPVIDESQNEAEIYQRSQIGASRAISEDGPLPLAPHPFIRSEVVLRTDGLRKKNARFEIPTERNLQTIDNLINVAKSEGEVKELKQQKRLLRNRQAALDSRQRKKVHTERLEEEKRTHLNYIRQLEIMNETLRAKEFDWANLQTNWRCQQEQYMAYVDQVESEKEQLLHQHTVELAAVRKENADLKLALYELQRSSDTPSDRKAFDDFRDQPQSGSSILGQSAFLEHNQSPSSLSSGTVSALLNIILLFGAWAVIQDKTPRLLKQPELIQDVKSTSQSLLLSLQAHSQGGLDLNGRASESYTSLDGSSAIAFPSLVETYTKLPHEFHAEQPSLIWATDEKMGLNCPNLNTDQPKAMSAGGRNDVTFSLTQDANLHSAARQLREQIPAGVLKDFTRFLQSENSSWPSTLAPDRFTKGMSYSPHRPA